MRTKLQLAFLQSLLGLILFVFAPFNFYGQVVDNESMLNKKVSFGNQQLQIEKVFSTVTKQTGVLFSFKSNLIPIHSAILLPASDMTVQEVVLYISKEAHVNWKFIAPNTIVFFPTQKPPKVVNIRISGFVLDSLYNEKLVAASIHVSNSPDYVLTNQDGFFSIILPKDSVCLSASYIGYESKTICINPLKTSAITFEMSHNPMLAIAEVSSSQQSNTLSADKSAAIKLKAGHINETAPLFGESDVFRTMQLLPGVQSVGEGTPGLLVRGGSPDQNLVLLDGIQIYNPVHIFGFYSVFNPSIVKNVTLHKSHFPAKFGGRLSSVIDVHTIDGNTKEIKGEVSAGFVGSKIAVDGPIGSKKATSFSLSARRSHVDLLLSPFIDPDLSTQQAGFLTAYFFYDINAKLTHRFSPTDKLTISAYAGQDKASINNTFQSTFQGADIIEKDNQQFTWGNKMLSASYAKIISKKFYLKSDIWYVEYGFGNKNNYSYTRSLPSQSIEESFFDYQFDSKIQDIGAKISLDALLYNWWDLNIGVYGIEHLFQPGVTSINSNFNSLPPNMFSDRRNMGIEYIGFFDNTFKLPHDFTLHTGAQYSSFWVNNENYQKFQPRLHLHKKIGEQLSVTASYANMQQFMHLLSVATTGIPNDLWVLASENIAPQSSDQFSLNAQIQYPKWNASIAVFTKQMRNVLEYKDATNFLQVSDNWENNVTSGTAIAEGVELFFEKTAGNLSGWIAYTYNLSLRYFDDINNGIPFYPKNYRKHDFVTYANYKLTSNKSLSVNFVFASGNPITLPEQVLPASLPYQQNLQVFVPGARNNYFLVDYHRLDINYSVYKFNRFGKRVWSFGFYNAYNQQNPFYVTPALNNDGKRKLRQVTLFPIIPSVNFSQSF